MSQADSLLETYGAATHQGVFGVPAVFSRAGQDSTSFTVTWNDQEYEVVDAEGFLTKVRMRDFEFPVTKPVVAGETLAPRAGDSIKLTENGVLARYELVPVGKRPAAELAPGGFRWLVHTKQVALDP